MDYTNANQVVETNYTLRQFIHIVIVLTIVIRVMETKSIYHQMLLRDVQINVEIVNILIAVILHVLDNVLKMNLWKSEKKLDIV